MEETIQQQILNTLLSGRSIFAYEWIQNIGTKHLNAHIIHLKNKGHNIQFEKIKYGRKSSRKYFIPK